MRPLLIDPKLARNLRRYLAQVGVAALALMLALWGADLLTGALAARAVLVAAVASTAFVLFISPHSGSAAPRHVVGGHGLAVAVAAPFAFFAGGISEGAFITGLSLLFGVYAAVAVGLAMLVMAATNTEHAPAAGTALAVVAHGFDWTLVVFIAAAVASLAAVHRLLRNWMRDLY